MSKILVTDRANEHYSVDGKAGSTVMEIVRDAVADDGFACCGGHCSCATCHVYVDDAYLATLPEMSAEESDLLDGSSHRRANSRLSCQVPYTDALDGATIAIAPAD